MAPRKKRRVHWHTIRLYPFKGSRLYVRVVVFDKRAHAIEAWRGWGMTRKAARNAGAFCCSATTRRKRWGEVCCVTFVRGMMGVGTVTHEFLHAALYVAHRKRWHLGELCCKVPGVMPYNAVEERLARVLTYCVQKFTNTGYERGWYK